MENKMEEKALTPNDPEFLPVQFDLTEAKLNQLTEDYDPSLIPEVVDVGDENYTFVHNKVMAIVKIRTGADKVRVKLKADSLAWGRKVDAYLKGLTDKLIALEEPWRQVKLDLEEAERKEAAEKMEAERKHQAEIEKRIADIRILAEGLIGASAADIQKNIDILDNMVISVALFADYQEAAKLTGDIVRKSLVLALEERTTFEAGQAALVTHQAEMAEKQAEMDAQQKALDKQKADQEAAERAAKAAEEAESQRKADLNASQQRTVDDAQATKKEVAYLKKRKPQDKEAREFAERLSIAACSKPDLEDEYLKELVADAAGAVLSAALIINTATQGGK
jgi:hypothetical protein